MLSGARSRPRASAADLRPGRRQARGREPRCCTAARDRVLDDLRVRSGRRGPAAERRARRDRQCSQIPAADAQPTASLQDVLALIEEMKAGKVDCLLIHDLNPVFSLPASAGFAEALAKVDSSSPSPRSRTRRPKPRTCCSRITRRWRAGATRVRDRAFDPWFSRRFDRCMTRRRSATRCSALRVPGWQRAASCRRAPSRASSKRTGPVTNWRHALARGGVFGDTPTRTVVARQALETSAARPELQGSGDFTLVAFPHSYWTTARARRCPGCRRFPTRSRSFPGTPGPRSACQGREARRDLRRRRHGRTDAGSIDVSVFPRGGIRDDVVAIPIGQGHTVGYYASMEGDEESAAGRRARRQRRGSLPAATDEAGGQAYLSTKASVTKTGRFRRLALSQWTDNQRERGLAPEVSLYDLAKAAAWRTSQPPQRHPSPSTQKQARRQRRGGHHFEVRPSNSIRQRRRSRPALPLGHDDRQRSCTGCSRLRRRLLHREQRLDRGRAQAIRHREMTWMRIERYVGDGDRRRDGQSDGRRRTREARRVEVRHLPMLCQHCGAAPCEAVCPVIATYHTDEGINGMVYNRCVGTRYCGNNCTYKVRRFNYFDYGRRTGPACSA